MCKLIFITGPEMSGKTRLANLITEGRKFCFVAAELPSQLNWADIPHQCDYVVFDEIIVTHAFIKQMHELMQKVEISYRSAYGSTKTRTVPNFIVCTQQEIVSKNDKVSIFNLKNSFSNAIVA